jgi:hypothetical protein
MFGWTHAVAGITFSALKQDCARLYARVEDTAIRAECRAPEVLYTHVDFMQRGITSRKLSL